MLNLVYKNGDNEGKLVYDLENFENINDLNNDKSLELRQLKLVITGFKKMSNLNIFFSVETKIKNILEIFINNSKLVNKVIENKNIYYNNDINMIFSKNNYKSIFSQLNKDLNDNLKMSFFEFFILNRNYKNNIIDLIKICYQRLINNFNIETNIFSYYNNSYSEISKEIKIKKVIYSNQIFDKIIKLITKIALINSKYFFLNNIKYNYTLLKFCDKSMKILNSILLFCLLCDINIPYYCFHSDLSIAGNCRMCLVQLDTSLKPIASCAVGISINSTIYTNTKIIQKAREGVLEFLLINHPLDCPICDQGGECDLQEQFITYGNDRGRFLKRMI